MSAPYVLGESSAFTEAFARAPQATQSPASPGVLLPLACALLLLVGACAPEVKPEPDTGTGVEETDTDTDADTDTDTDTDADTDTVPDCDAVVSAMTPEDGSFDVELDTPVVATFSAAVVGAFLEIEGLEGTSTLATDGLSATFVPDAGLATGMTYEATAIVCGNPRSTTFTSIGEELDIDLTGRTYDVELDSSDLVWVTPTLGSYLADQLVTNSLLFMVETANTSEIDMVAAAGFDMGSSVAQYPCAYAVDFDSVPYTDHPTFSVGPEDASLEADGVAFEVYSLAATGVIAEDAESVTDLVITGLLDTRNLSTSLGVDVCGFSATFGDACIACPDGEVLCLPMEIQDPSAPWREDVTLDPDLDPTADVICN